MMSTRTLFTALLPMLFHSNLCQACDGTAANSYGGDPKRHILSIKQGEEVKGLEYGLRDPKTGDVIYCAGPNCYMGSLGAGPNIVDHACEFEDEVVNQGQYERIRFKRTVTTYPWMVKSQGELTFYQCQAATRHDSNFWWSKGACHMKFIRYAAGVVLRDTRAREDSNTVLRKGVLLTSLTQYDQKEGFYCGHGDYCYPSKDIRLLGSAVIGSDGSELGTSCELIAADSLNITEAGAQKLFQDCH